MMKTLPLAAACLGLVACQQESKPAPEDPAPAPGKEASTPLDDSDSYLGLALEAASARAEQAGIRWRVVEEDGQGKPVTKDYRPDRLNFSVASGKVIRVTKG